MLTSYKGAMRFRMFSERWEDIVQGRCLWLEGEGPCGGIVKVGPIISFDPDTNIVTTINGHRWTVKFGKGRAKKYGQLIMMVCERLLH